MKASAPSPVPSEAMPRSFHEGTEASFAPSRRDDFAWCRTWLASNTSAMDVTTKTAIWRVLGIPPGQFPNPTTFRAQLTELFASVGENEGGTGGWEVDV